MSNGESLPQPTSPVSQPSGHHATGLSVAGLVLGIVGLVFAFIPLVGLPVGIAGGALALIFGLVGLVKKHGGLAIASVALGAVAVLVAVLMTTLVYSAATAVSDSVDEAAASASSSFDDMTGANTGTLLQTDVTVAFGSVTTDDYFLSVPVTVTNISDDTESYLITVAAADAAGNQLDTSTISITDLLVGQSTTQDAFTLVSADEADTYRTATFSVTSVSLF